MSPYRSIKKNLAIVLTAILMILAELVLLPNVLLAENRKPLAVIDGTLKAKVGETVYLNGDLSSDPEGDTLTYAWTILSWPKSGQPLGSQDKRFQFEADTPGKYVVQLVVNDNYLASEPATVTVIVTEGD